MTHQHPEAIEYAAAAPELERANPPEIVDVIALPWMYDPKRIHYYVVVSRSLKYLYARTPNEQQHYYRGPVSSSRFTGKDGGFYNFLAGTGAKGDAFAGRTFDIQLDDGTKFHCLGDVWSVGPPPGLDTVSVGAASQEQLNDCYCFIGSHVERSLLNAWLANNKPKSEYSSRDPKEPARKAWKAQMAAEAAALAEKQANCTHDYEEAEGTTEVGDGDDCYEVDCTFDRCKLCGHETEARIVEDDGTLYDTENMR